MTVHFVGAGPGDPELLTRKAERLLRSCTVCIWAGSLVNPEVLDFLPAGAEVHDSASMSLEEIIAVMKQAHDLGKDVVRLHTGDPSIYGAIAEQMRELLRLAIPYAVVPGVSSFQAAAAAIKAELTIPNVSQTIVLSRVADRTPVPHDENLERLALDGATLCLFLSVHKIEDIVARLKPILTAQCPVAVVYRASWPDERVVIGTLGTIAALVHEARIGRQAMIIIGRALVADHPASKLYDPQFAHGYRSAKDAP